MIKVGERVFLLVVEEVEVELEDLIKDFLVKFEEEDKEGFEDLNELVGNDDEEIDDLDFGVIF